MSAKKRKKIRPNSFYRSVKRLEKSGYIEFQETKQGVKLQITQKGECQLELIESTRYQIEKPKRWDKKWRMVIFDIKEERSSLRAKLRTTLNTLGFVQLQKSIWVHPYNCEDLVTLIKTDFHIGKEVLYIIADTIENDRELKKHFKLEKN